MQRSPFAILNHCYVTLHTRRYAKTIDPWRANDDLSVLENKRSGLYWLRSSACKRQIAADFCKHHKLVHKSSLEQSSLTRRIRSTPWQDRCTLNQNHDRLEFVSKIERLLCSVHVSHYMIHGTPHVILKTILEHKQNSFPPLSCSSATELMQQFDAVHAKYLKLNEAITKRFAIHHRERPSTWNL